MVEDGGAILCTAVTELSIGCRRVDVVPEDFEELGVANLGWIVDNLDRLGVSSFACRHFLVGGSLFVPSCIAGRGRDHACQLVERGFHTPETATGKRRLCEAGTVRSGLGIAHG